MTASMIEAVARAIDPWAWDARGEEYRRIVIIPKAERAIAAMREPSAEMVEALRLELGDDSWSNYDLTLLWQAGIDAAYVSRARELLRAALPAAKALPALVEAVENALVSLQICLLPRLDTKVASNEQILETTIAGLHAALAAVRGKP
jgi:hypothetical protein